MKSSATPATPKPSQDPRALRVVGGGRGARGEGGDYQDLRGGAGETMGATEMGFYGGVMHTNTHEFAAKKKPRQNSCDAVAWASYAPMRLHRQNRRGGMLKLPIIAPSEPNGGGR